MGIFSLITILVVSTALAFKKQALGAGQIYCSNAGACCSDLRNFKVDNDQGTVTDPCIGKAYVCTGAECIELPLNTKFKATPAGQ